MKSIEQKIIDTAIEFKEISLKMGKEVSGMKKDEITEKFVQKKFENPNKVVHRLFQLLDEYEFSKGLSKRLDS